MRRILFHNSELRLEEAPPPVPGIGEVLIRAAAIGVTLPVVRMARGSGPGVLGGEVAGEVLALGPGVTGFAVGEHVTTLPFTGSYADLVVAPAAMTSKIPAGAEVTAVALIRSGHVALAALTSLRPGESVLITAAAGGVGHLAVQLARILGAGRVVAAVSDKAKADFVRDHGADDVVLYSDDTWPEPVDLVLDGAGGQVLPQALSATRPGGRLIYYSSGGGTLQASDLLGGATTVTGLAMRHFAALHPDLYAAHELELWRLATAGRLRPAVHAELPLTEAARAHEILESRANLGKVVLRP